MENTILVIDDKDELRENTNELLQLAGFKTFVAKDGKEGLEIAKTAKPDLILCDIMMPQLDGYGVIRALENIPEMATVPFVFMSAKAEKADFRMGMDLGADDYLTKPFSGDDLLRIVNARLKKHELLKKSYQNNAEGLDSFLKAAKEQPGLDVLSENRPVKKIRKKDMLFMEGDTPNYLYFIVSGKVKIIKSNEQGKEYIINIYKEGDFLGYVELLEDSNHRESALALEDTEIVLITREDFLKLVYTNSAVAMKFLKIMSGNFTEAADKLIKLAYDSARKRVAEAILFVSQKYKKEGKDDLSFSLLRENISALSGISPESVSRNLTDFREEGLIETSNGSIKIINLRKLETIKN